MAAAFDGRHRGARRKESRSGRRPGSMNGRASRAFGVRTNDCRLQSVGFLVGPRMSHSENRFPVFGLMR